MTVLMYILVCLIFGSSWIAIKIGVSFAPPLYAASLRFVISVLLLAAVIRIRDYHLPRDPRKLLRLAYPGLYMYGFHFALIYFAEQYINSALTSVLFATFPMFVALLSLRLLRDERLATRGWLGLALGMIGIVLISADSLRLSDHLFLGTLLALAGTLAAAYGMVLHRRHHSRHNVVVAATAQMTLGGLPLLAAALIFEDWSAFRFTPESVGSLLYLSVIATVVVFLAYYWLLGRLRAVTVSLMAFITPIVATFIGMVFFGEHLTSLMIAGAALILLSILLIVKKSA